MASSFFTLAFRAESAGSASGPVPTRRDRSRGRGTSVPTRRDRRMVHPSEEEESPSTFASSSPVMVLLFFLLACAKFTQFAIRIEQQTYAYQSLGTLARILAYVYVSYIVPTLMNAAIHLSLMLFAWFSCVSHRAFVISHVVRKWLALRLTSLSAAFLILLLKLELRFARSSSFS